MKTLLLTLAAMLLFSGCVYRVPSSTEYVTRTSYPYTIPADQAYGIHRDKHYPVTNGREKKRYMDKEKQKPHHISEPDSNRFSIKTEHPGTKPMVHPQYRQKQETVNRKNPKPKVHPQHQETRKVDNRDSSGPNVQPQHAENKKRSDQSKKREATMANTKASKL